MIGWWTKLASLFAWRRADREIARRLQTYVGPRSPLDRLGSLRLPGNQWPTPRGW